MVSLIHIFLLLFLFLGLFVSFVILSPFREAPFPAFYTSPVRPPLDFGYFFSWFICFVCHAFFFFEFISREFAQNSTTILPLIQVSWVRWVTFCSSPTSILVDGVFSGITPYTFGFLLSDLMDFRIILSLIFSLHLASLLTQQL